MFNGLVLWSAQYSQTVKRLRQQRIHTAAGDQKGAALGLLALHAQPAEIEGTP